MVSVRDRIASLRFPCVRLWWVHVTVTPEARRTAVFSRGTSNGFKGVIPEGGQHPPISGVGERLEWKNAQKNPRKKNTSDVINRIIPYRRFFWTGGV